MAMLGLVRDLSRKHQWTLQVWHGNHGWHQEAQHCCDGLKAWCQDQGLPFQSESANPDEVQSEAKARAWRYARLEATARKLQAVVATAHTATDRTETLMLQLARGTDLRGLCSLREQRPIREHTHPAIQLSRPMLVFQRNNTKEICQTLNMPTWVDPTNASPSFARNRVRNEVLPVLEELYPGCSGRISDLSERLSKIQDIQQELVDACLDNNKGSASKIRELIKTSSLPVRRVLVNRWISQQGAPALNADDLDRLCRRLGPRQPAGSTNLGKGWQISWTKKNLALTPPEA